MRWLVAAIGLAASPSFADIKSATYTDPTTRYAHGILGDAIEFETLSVTMTDGSVVNLSWRDTIVFEDLEPRLADVNGDGAPELIVIESHENLGARLAVYGVDGKAVVLFAATDFIGRSNRWLAPLGAADLDGDGAIELAFIDRPHLAKVLRVFRYLETGGKPALTLIAERQGLTNHKIGEDFISGGIRDCGQGPEIITADAGWNRIVATRLDADGQLNSTDIGAFTGPKSLKTAVDRC